MLPGDITEGIPEWRAEVTVNGVVRDVRGISWDTVIAGDLPDQVVASGGLSGTTGKIAWASQDPVSPRPVSPWAKVAGWPPSPGDQVQIRVTDGVTWWTRWSGVIDDTTGDPTSGFQSKIIDHRDRITGLFTHEALLRHSPPRLENGDYRSIGLSFWYPLTMALRSCGFYNVPEIEAPSALSVPMQGSMWPEAGTIDTGDGIDGTIHAGFYETEWGYAAGAFNNTYLPRLDEPTTTPVQITFLVPPEHTGVSTVDVSYGPRTIRLRVNTGRGVTAFFSATGAAPWTTVASLPMGNGTIFTLLVKNGAWALRTNAGGQATGSQALGTGAMSQVRVTADTNGRMAGLQVSHPNSSVREFASLDFEPNMRFIPSGLASTMDMMPAIKGRSVSDLVDEILKATLTASWWDESGALVLTPSNILRGGEPVQTVTTADDVTSLSWEDSLLSVRSTVEVSWKDPLISKGKQYRLELWRGREESFVSGDDPREQFVTPEPGFEWFGVDRTVNKLGQDTWGSYNDRRGSYGGLRYEDSDGEEVPTTVASVSVTTRNLYADSLIITTTVNGIAGDYEGISATSLVAPALREHLRGQALPVVRGMGIGEWIDATYQASAGPEGAPLLVHELGYWGGEYFEGGSVAQRIGDYLAGMVSHPQPVITDLGLIYDPRRQLGDVLTLRSEWIGIELRLLITRISEDHSEGAKQTVTVAVIAASSIRPVTYAELAAVWTSGDYSALESVWGLLDYDAFTAAPLEGAPA